MTKNSLTDALRRYVENKGGVKDKELEILLKTITLEEIYGSKESKNNRKSKLDL